MSILNKYVKVKGHDDRYTMVEFFGVGEVNGPNKYAELVNKRSSPENVRYELKFVVNG